MQPLRPVSFKVRGGRLHKTVKVSPPFKPSRICFTASFKVYRKPSHLFNANNNSPRVQQWKYCIKKNIKFQLLAGSNVHSQMHGHHTRTRSLERARPGYENLDDGGKGWNVKYKKERLEGEHGENCVSLLHDLSQKVRPLAETNCAWTPSGLRSGRFWAPSTYCLWLRS